MNAPRRRTQRLEVAEFEAIDHFLPDPEKAGAWIPWFASLLALFWVAGAGALTYALAPQHDILALSMALQLALGIAVIALALLLIFSGFVAREGVRANRASQLLVHAAQKLMAPAASATAEVKDLGAAVRAHAQAFDVAIRSAHERLRELEAGLSGQVTAIEGASARARADAVSLVEGLGKERKALIDLGQNLQAQSQLAASAVSRSAQIVAKAGETAETEVKRSENLLLERLKNISQAASGLSEHSQAIARATGEMQNRTQSLEQMLIRSENSVAQASLNARNAGEAATIAVDATKEVAASIQKIITTALDQSKTVLDEARNQSHRLAGSGAQHLEDLRLRAQEAEAAVEAARRAILGYAVDAETRLKDVSAALQDATNKADKAAEIRFSQATRIMEQAAAALGQTANIAAARNPERAAQLSANVGSAIAGGLTPTLGAGTAGLPGMARGQTTHPSVPPQRPEPAPATMQQSRPSASPPSPQLPIAAAGEPKRPSETGMAPKGYSAPFSQPETLFANRTRPAEAMARSLSERAQPMLGDAQDANPQGQAPLPNRQTTQQASQPLRPVQPAQTTNVAKDSSWDALFRDSASEPARDHIWSELSSTPQAQALQVQPESRRPDAQPESPRDTWLGQTDNRPHSFSDPLMDHYLGTPVGPKPQSANPQPAKPDPAPPRADWLLDRDDDLNDAITNRKSDGSAPGAGAGDGNWSWKDVLASIDENGSDIRPFQQVRAASEAMGLKPMHAFRGSDLDRILARSTQGDGARRKAVREAASDPVRRMERRIKRDEEYARAAQQFVDGFAPRLIRALKAPNRDTETLALYNSEEGRLFLLVDAALG